MAKRLMTHIVWQCLEEVNFKIMALNFYEMLKPENLSKIEREDLQRLELKHLEAFARLLGIYWSGSKERRIERISHAVKMRTLLAKVNEPDELVSGYKRRELVTFSKGLGLFYSTSKYALSVGLIGWRNKCRKEGQKFLTEIKGEIAKYPKQQRLFR